MQGNKILENAAMNDEELDKIAGGKFDPNNPEDMEKLKEVMQKIGSAINIIINTFTGEGENSNTNKV